MKIIQQRLVCLIFASTIGLLFSLILFVDNFITYRIDMHILLVLLLSVSNLLVVFLIREYQVKRLAKLIIENKIMHIEAAEIDQNFDETDNKPLRVAGLETFISCFGILLGSKVIKFNIDGINLKKVEIGNDFISLVYGKDKKSENIRLLHKVMEEQELKNIVKRFQYETGITPIIVD